MIQRLFEMKLPKDLNDCERSLFYSLKNFFESKTSNRVQANILFEGLKLQPIIYRLLNNLKSIGIDSIITFSDYGNSALAKRDYPEIREQIYTFKELVELNYNQDNTLVIACSPQPYEFDDFETLCNSINSRILMINGKLEETSIGVGSVGRERRIRFIKSWDYAYLLQPFRKGALLYEFSKKWMLFSYGIDGYRFISSYDIKPDKEEIDQRLGF